MSEQEGTVPPENHAEALPDPHDQRVPAELDARDDAVFKALANSTRRRILDLLRIRPRSTGEVCAAFETLDRTTVLQHIRVLERAELLTGTRSGKVRTLALAPVPIKRIHDRWIGEYTHAAVGLLARLGDPDSSGSSAR